MPLPYRIAPEGDAALVISFGDTIDPTLTALVRAARARLEAARLPGVSDLIGAYCTLMVCYDPLVMSYTELSAQIGACLRDVGAAGTGAGRIVEIPVCYGGELGPDLEDVAAHAGMDVEEVVRRHTAGRYRISMLGFLPGFAYLSGLDPQLETPRLAVPRTLVPAGAVGIGGAQAGLYPLASPGGWRLIGRTPARLYRPELADDPIPYAPGDELRFYAIDRATYDDMAGRVAHGEDVLRTRPAEGDEAGDGCAGECGRGAGAGKAYATNAQMARPEDGGIDESKRDTSASATEPLAHHDLEGRR